jgi:hypothetical protein
LVLDRYPRRVRAHHSVNGNRSPWPNPRVQRTRSSPSARHSPLTRHPLGAIARQTAAGAPSRKLCAGSRFAVPVASRMVAVEGARQRRRCSARRPPAGCGPTTSAPETGRSVSRARSWHQTTCLSARPPSQSASVWRAGGDRETSLMGAPACRIPWSRPVVSEASLGV